MSTINLDLSQKVDVSCREGDDFDYFIGATNEDGGALDVSSDTIFLFTIKDLKNEPIKIMSNEKRVHSDMTDLVSGFNQLGLATFEADDYEKRAFAIQKVIDSREINATAFSDKYHPKRTQRLNSLIGGVNQLFDTSTKETADKMWFTMSPFFDSSNELLFYQPPFFYSEDEKILKLQLDSVSFDLPVGKYKYDIKMLSGLYCPRDNENLPIIEKAVFESVITLIFGSLNVKKD